MAGLGSAAWLVRSGARQPRRKHLADEVVQAPILAVRPIAKPATALTGKPDRDDIPGRDARGRPAAIPLRLAPTKNHRRSRDLWASDLTER